MSVTWECLCPQHQIKAWTLDGCTRCGSERPDTAALAKIAVEVRIAQEALDQFDRLSDSYGRLQAMQVVLMRHVRGL